MTTELHRPRDCIDRRRFLTMTAGLAIGSTLGTGLLARPASAAEDDLATFFANTDNVTELVDRRGEPSVEIIVGSAGNGGSFGFEPAAVRVDPGTTVVWTWSGEGGMHNVVAKNGAFKSEFYTKPGETYEFTPVTTGEHRYVCAPHEMMGMRGVLVVGDGAVSLGSVAGSSSSSGTRSAETFDGWLARTDNYDSITDLRGESTVTVEVGADGNGGAFAFEPAAIHVDPGTTVIWEWVGKNEYDVSDPELGYQSDLLAGQGNRFAVEFDGHGLSKYECSAYGEQGMRGVVIVGNGPDPVLSPLGKVLTGGTAVVLGAPFLYGLHRHISDSTSYDEADQFANGTEG
ncbi:halocyanin domain-containing protein [Haladaptatus sp. GCM10025893]|uniref:halocyanin domain-containing protein n=1 Tax=Haladaptatus sp. GCM10025893 TaxID=3252659 RepID=UPI00361F9473